jgi:hypothetical protein
MNKQGNHLSPEYPENRRDTLFLLNKDNERAFHAPHEKYLGMDDNELSLEYNAYDPLTPSGECASSSSKYQAVRFKHFSPYFINLILDGI